MLFGEWKNSHSSPQCHLFSSMTSAKVAGMIQHWRFHSVPFVELRARKTLTQCRSVYNVTLSTNYCPFPWPRIASCRVHFLCEKAQLDVDGTRLVIQRPIHETGRRLGDYLRHKYKVSLLGWMTSQKIFLCPGKSAKVPLKQLEDGGAFKT